MTAEVDGSSGFASEDDVPIPYMARTRAYYQAIGYETPYRWAHYTDAPFQPLQKPLRHARVALVTTAAPFDPAERYANAAAALNCRGVGARTACPVSRTKRARLRAWTARWST